MIELYHSEGCPFCVKVRVAFEQMGVAYISKAMPLRVTSCFKDELIKLGGKSQVPFLVDPERGLQMYESDDIIDYVKKNYIKS
ncbi:MAG: glutathione S-transferase N-terminal domain-containing protein [Proteobacteria bacterium]|nr:glutathione S-transferase N-terminal domain-containing protein [Pseudomonadota bacterium]